MCNLYSITTNQAAIIALFRVINRYVGNLAPMPGVFPDYKAPIVRNGAEGRELATARWGMPSSSKALMDATKKRAERLQDKGKTVDFKELLRMEPDGGTTNIRNVKSKHWTRWLGAENRCVVPFNSFSEFNKAEGGDIWFALDETRPLACFAGIWTNWTSVRKVKEGETTNDLYAFLTTEPNVEVGAIHPKAMPVILTTPDEVEAWLTASGNIVVPPATPNAVELVPETLPIAGCGFCILVNRNEDSMPIALLHCALDLAVRTYDRAIELIERRSRLKTWWKQNNSTSDFPHSMQQALKIETFSNKWG